MDAKEVLENKNASDSCFTRCHSNLNECTEINFEDTLNSPKKYFTISQHRRYQRKQALKRNKFNKNDKCNNTEIKSTTPIENFSHKVVNTVPENLHCIAKNLTVKQKVSSVDKKENLNSTTKEIDESKSHLDGIDLEVKKLPCRSTNDSSEITVVKETVKMEKSKEEIQSERQAKKQLKQLKKNKTVTDSESKSTNIKTSSPSTIITKTNDIIVNECTIQEKKDQSANTKTCSEEKQSIITACEEKSREDIKAEREAKKLAKQLAKSKSKSSADVVELEAKLSSVTLKEKKNEDECKQKNNSENDTTNQDRKKVKSNSELKAERRAKQESQRAAKELLQTVKAPSKKNTLNVPATEKPKQNDAPLDIKKSQSPEKTKEKLIQSQHKVKLFNHLYGERETAYMIPSIPLNSKEIHPAIVRLGVQYASHIIMGSNARCIALLNALKQVIEDYALPPNVEFSRGLEAHLTPSINFLKSCRPPAVSMNNALKHIKWQITQLPNNITEYEAKSKLQEAIDTYIKEQIEVAGQAISIAVCNKISNGDVILTYGCSSLIEKIVTEAAEEKHFRVVVVAAHPWNEGREMLRRLTAKGVKCSLIMISALSFVMREINKVLLGAGALLANGYVMARAGTAQVAMVAHAHNVPVLVCCETHKFSERVQTDSFVYNEIGNPDDLIKCNPSYQDGPLSNWRTFNSLTLLNLTYDVTPPDLVTAVVTELAILPCTSVPVILRIKPSEF